MSDDLSELAHRALNPAPLRDSYHPTRDYPPACGTCFYFHPSERQNGKGWCRLNAPYIRLVNKRQVCDDHATLNIADEIELSFPNGPTEYDIRPSQRSAA